jgi:cell division protein ZapA (FtsZ GTPase activity inhibitor)
MRELQQQKPHQSPLQTAILAGLNLVDELFKMQVDYQSAESDIAQRTSRLTTSLGRVFQDVEIESGQSTD